MARTLELTFSSTVKVTPTHSPPASAIKDTEPFIKPTKPTTASSSEFPGTDFSAVKHQSTSKIQTHRPGSTSSERTGIDLSAARHQSTSKLQSNQPHTDLPESSDLTGTDSPVLHRSRKDSISSLSPEAEGEVSDRPPLDLYAKERELLEDQDITVSAGPVYL